MLLAEFKANLDQYQSAISRNFLSCFLPATILSGLLLIPFWGLQQKMQSLNHSNTELILRGACGIAAMAVFLAMAGVFIAKTGKLRKKFGLICPECGKPLWSQVVIASGRCGSCGAVIILEITK